MARPKKIQTEVTTEIVEKDFKLELTKLLRKEIPQCFEREPNSGYTPHLNTVVEHIINLFK